MKYSRYHTWSIISSKLCMSYRILTLSSSRLQLYSTIDGWPSTGGMHNRRDTSQRGTAMPIINTIWYNDTIYVIMKYSATYHSILQYKYISLFILKTKKKKSQSKHQSIRIHSYHTLSYLIIPKTNIIDYYQVGSHLTALCHPIYKREQIDIIANVLVLDPQR